MSSFFIDKTDPQIAEILDRLKRMNKILQKTETLVQPTLNNEKFLTDEELSKILSPLYIYTHFYPHPFLKITLLFHNPL